MTASKPTGTLTFVAFHKPPLEDGDYILTVGQQVKIGGEYGWGTDESSAAAPSATLRFSVAGPRFALDPGDIQSRFPPAGSLGEYATVLPHVIFNRTTIAWERCVDATASTRDPDAPPWLALLLLDSAADGPSTRVHNLTVQELLNVYGASATPPGQPAFCRVIERGAADAPGPGDLKLEAGQQPGDVLTVLDVPRRLLWQILPSRAELGLVAHVRKGLSASTPPEAAEYPVVFGTRLPAAGTRATGTQSTVHLVSLESRQPLLDELTTTTPPADDGLVRLVSLASWSFSTLQESATFAGRVKAAWCPDASRTDPPDQNTPSACASGLVHTLRMPVSGNAGAERLLSAGYAPVRHQTRQGNHLVSWYRGPLVPGPAPAAGRPRSVASSDQLMRYWSTVGMFDTSYAAAWELGRALTLRGKAAVSLFNWKRAYAQQARRAREAVSHLPFAPPPGTPPALPEDVSAWFGELLLLRNVPFHYLVPRQEMLPPESLRFFTVDPEWVECLLDGAFSIGRVSSGDLNADRAHTERGVVPRAPACSGFLLRSQAVSGWPDLGVEGYAETVSPADAANYIPSVPPAALLRMDRLAPDLLLCIFQGHVQTVDVHEHPDVIHFGVDSTDPGQTDTYYKELRRLNGKLSGVRTRLPWKHESPAARTLNVVALAAVERAANSANSADFAVMMIEGVDKVRFLRT